MSRLIDADALYRDICDSMNEMTKIGIAVDAEWMWAKLNDALENAPTIEPERKKGRWIEEPNCYYRCSECGDHYPSIRGYMSYNYCPTCGVGMKRTMDQYIYERFKD